MPPGHSGSQHLAKSSVDAMKGGAIDLLKSGVSAAPDTDDYLDDQVPSLDRRLQLDAVDSLIEHGYLGPQETSFNSSWEGVPAEILVGNPPHIDPRLTDNDGPHIDTDGMTLKEIEDVRRMQDQWRDFTSSSEYSQIVEHTHQSTFYKYFVDPSL